ncbi:hypothetical protein CCMA1212_008817 [Trichoderma ghanense]|uniref:Uncharacterized protein n=1 Tax=Trichoderma ghanense TaxID=65468 RepID=A0ABY2GX29_9HYPO
MASHFQYINTSAAPLGETRDINAILEVVKENLQEILRIKAQKPFSISPKTEKRLRDLLARWDTGDYTGLNNATEYRALLSEINSRVEADAKYADALARLGDLDVMSFQLRYREYFPSGFEELDKSSLRLVGTQKDAFCGEPHTLSEIEEEALAFFEAQEWINIWERLGREPAFRWPAFPLHGNSAKESPLVHLLQVLARLNDTWPDTIIATLGAYIDRNAATQSRIAELAAADKVLLVASTIEEDLGDLDSAPDVWKEAVPAIRDAIFVVVARYFTVFIWEEQARRCWALEWRGKSSNMAIIRTIKRIAREPDELVDDFVLHFSL